MREAHVPALVRPGSLAEALAELERLGADGQPIAGGTWVMLAPLRRAPLAQAYVAVGALEELHGLEPGDPIRVGAAATHAELAGLEGPAARALAEASRGTPVAIGNVATLAGNLRAAPYPGADLVPALLALDASLQVAVASGSSWLPVADYLVTRDARPAGELVVAALVPAPPGRRSAYERLTVRGGGEEAVAAMAVSVDVDPSGEVVSARVAAGAVEALSRRIPEAEDALVGSPLGEPAAADAGRAAAAVLDAIDGPDAPAWYRLAVVPSLLRRAVARLEP